MATTKPRIQAYIKQYLYDAFKAERKTWGLKESEALERILSERYDKAIPSASEPPIPYQGDRLTYLEKSLAEQEAINHDIIYRLERLEKLLILNGKSPVSEGELPGSELIGESLSELPESELPVSDGELPDSESLVSDSELPESELPVSDGELLSSELASEYLSELPGSESPVSDGELPSSELVGKSLGELPDSESLVSDGELPSSELVGESLGELPDSESLVSDGELLKPVDSSRLFVICRFNVLPPSDPEDYNYWGSSKLGFTSRLEKATKYKSLKVASKAAQKIKESDISYADDNAAGWNIKINTLEFFEGKQAERAAAIALT